MTCMVLANTGRLSPKLHSNHQQDFSGLNSKDADDHKLMAMVRQTTRCDGRARFRFSSLCVSPIACSIAADGIAVSKALSTVPDSTTVEISENSLSCIRTQYTQCTTFSLPGFGLNRTVLLRSSVLRANFKSYCGKWATLISGQVRCKRLTSVCLKPSTQPSTSYETGCNSSLIVHVDESPWPVLGVKEWLWVTAGAEFCLFHAADTRSRAELSQQLGDQFDGVLSTDD